MLGFMAFLTGEIFHCLAIGSVGRVLRSDGVKVFGRGLGIAAMLAGVLAVMCLCGLGMWVENENPNGQNPLAERQESIGFLIWATGAGIVTGGYLLLDLILLLQARHVIARLGVQETWGSSSEIEWDD